METPSNVDPETGIPLAPVPSPELDLDEIIDELNVAFRRLPVAAIHAARKCREAVVPRLIDAIRRATAAARADEPLDGNAHFFALYLLTEFKAKEAWPAIREAISLPGELPFELFDDAITSSLASVLAALIGDEHEAIDALIRNRALNEFVRVQAIEAYVELVFEQRLTREEAVARLQPHLREANENADRDIAGPLVGALADLIGSEAREEIETAFRLQLVDELIIDLPDAQRDLAADVAGLAKKLEQYDRGPIDDTIAELECRSAFADFDHDDEDFDDDEFDSEEFDDDDFLSDDERREYEALWRSQTSLFTPLVPRPRLEDSPVMPAEPFTVGTVRNATSRVGRNDPCPCGSGKKFKKCCGGKR